MSAQQSGRRSMRQTQTETDRDCTSLVTQKSTFTTQKNCLSVVFLFAGKSGAGSIIWERESVDRIHQKPEPSTFKYACGQIWVWIWQRKREIRLLQRVGRQQLSLFLKQLSGPLVSLFRFSARSPTQLSCAVSINLVFFPYPHAPHLLSVCLWVPEIFKLFPLVGSPNSPSCGWGGIEEATFYSLHRSALSRYILYIHHRAHYIATRSRNASARSRTSAKAKASAS